jgi:hypothetical protein
MQKHSHSCSFCIAGHTEIKHTFQYHTPATAGMWYLLHTAVIPGGGGYICSHTHTGVLDWYKQSC